MFNLLAHVMERGKVKILLVEDDEMILLDAYDTPIKVNRLELKDVAQQRYREVMNEWHAEWQNLSKIRKAEDV